MNFKDVEESSNHFLEGLKKFKIVDIPAEKQTANSHNSRQEGSRLGQIIQYARLIV
jgi:uncharacterized protein YciW